MFSVFVLLRNVKKFRAFETALLQKSVNVIIATRVCNKLPSEIKNCNNCINTI